MLCTYSETSHGGYRSGVTTLGPTIFTEQV